MITRVVTLAALAMAGWVPSAMGGANEVPVCDFESGDSITVFKPGPRFSFARKHVTEGQRSALVRFTAPLAASADFPADWTPYKAITCDVFNPGPATAFSVRIVGAKGKAYNIKSRAVPAGLSGLTIDVIDVTATIDGTKITEFTMAPLEGAPQLYMDNMRFLAIVPKRERVLMDFEDDLDIAFWEVKKGSVELSTEHVTSGKRSLKTAPDTYLAGWKLPPIWNGYDVMEVDFFNGTDAPVPLHVLVADKAWADSIPKGMSYWNRYNADYNIPPGKWIFSLSVTGMYRGHVGSRFNDLKTCIDPGSIVRMDFGLGKGGAGHVWMDNIRLVKAFVPEGVLAFDFGPESQVLQPGFRPVTWNTVYEKGATRYGMRRKAVNENRARDDTFPSKLYRDYLQFEGGSEFMLDLPNGTYHVFAAFDDLGYWGWEAARHNRRSIEAEGKAAWSEDRGELGGWRHVNHIFEEVEPLPGDDFWKLYMRKLFEPKRFVVDVADGQLNLKVIADAPWSSKLAGLIVYPDSMKMVGDKFAAETVQYQREEFSAAAVERPTPSGGDIARLPGAERSKGWLFFLTDYADNTYLTTVPAPGQISRKASIFAAQNEFEPVTFAVRPLRPLGRARVTVSDFSGPGGARIPASAWDVRVVRHLSRRGFSGIAYSIVPQTLRRFETVDLPAGLTREFWATVRVPKGARAGSYSGTIAVTSEGGLKEIISVTLEVLPVALDGSDYVFGFFGAPPNDEVARLLLDYGFNSFSGGPRIALNGFDAGGAPQLDFGRVDAFMERMKAAGYTKELCGYGGPGVGHIGYLKDEGFFGQWEKKTGKSYVELLRAVFDEMKKHAGEKEWLPFTYNLGDETRNPDYAKKQVAQIKAIMQAAPWLKTTAQYSVSYRGGADPKNYHQWIFEALKTSGLNNHDESVMEKARELGKLVYIYNQGQSRYSFGAYQWSEYRKGVQGRYQWHQHVQHGYQFFDLDGREPDTGVLYYGKDGPIPTIFLERCREGADDFYYCQTLWNLATRKGGALGEEAKRWLEGWTSRIRVNEKGRPEWLSNDEIRAKCAAYILKLSGMKVPETLDR